MIILRHVVWMHNGPHPVMQLEDDAAFMDKYSRQIGAFGLEAMSKLMNLKVLIVGLRYVFVACVRPCHIPMFCSYKQPASTKSNFFFYSFLLCLRVRLLDPPHRWGQGFQGSVADCDRG